MSLRDITDETDYITQMNKAYRKHERGDKLNMNLVEEVNHIFDEAINEVRKERVDAQEALMMENLVDICPVCHAKNTHLLADMCRSCEKVCRETA